jgi:hypothetical protein
VFYANAPVGHLATYGQDKGGEFARVGIGWLKWQLYDDMTEAGNGMFASPDCMLCKGGMWTVQKKNMERRRWFGRERTVLSEVMHTSCDRQRSAAHTTWFEARIRLHCDPSNPATHDPLHGLPLRAH